MLLRIFIWLTCVMFAATVNEAAEPSLGQTLKKIFATPTPTPHRKKRSAAAKKKSPTPTPSPGQTREKESPTPKPSASPSPKKKQAPSAEEESPTPTPKKKKASPTPTPSASPHRKKKKSPTPQPLETPASPETASPSPSSTTTPQEAPSPTPTPKKRGAANATLTPDQIKGFDNYPSKVQKLITGALELTTRNLDYKYGSADPNSGGMDCSGFVYFVLRQNGIGDVPRDSSEQYSWVRRARQFESVLSQKDDSFELEDLKPGDLLFWTGTYAIDRDPPITHAMIYLGREKRTGARVMVGASDGRIYQGQSRNGVSVFDFKVERRNNGDSGKPQPTFIGYGHIPGLRD